MSEQGKDVKKFDWEIISEPVGVRPEVQSYSSYDELPPIPISFPVRGAIGRTGDWRTFKPVVDYTKCTKCGLCYMYCPEGTIQWLEDEEKFVVDYEYCKGCGICADECPVHAIEMKREEE